MNNNNIMNEQSRCQLSIAGYLLGTVPTTHFDNNLNFEGNENKIGSVV